MRSLLRLSAPFVLALLLARSAPALGQAEAAPPESDPAPTAQPVASPTDPAGAPAAPTAPAAPAVPPASEAAEAVTSIGVGFGAGRRPGAAARDIPPRHGLAVAVRLGRQYVRIADLLELGAAFHFSYHRYAQDVTVMRGGPPFRDQRMLNYYDFGLLQTATLALGRLRPFLGLGGGMSLANFSTLEDDLAPGDAETTRPVLLGTGGVEVAIHGPNTRITLEVTGTHMFRPPAFTPSAGPKRSLFGNRVAATLGLRHAF